MADVSSELSNLPEGAAETTANALTAIGIRIREIRLARNMTLQALADATGLSPSMLSLVERGRASPSIGSLIVISNALRITMSDIIVSEPPQDERLVVRAGDQRVVETAEHVIRRVLREDRNRGISIAVNEYQPRTGSAENPITHNGFEYGYVLEGTLTVEVDGTSYTLEKGDLISYSSRRPHRLWNHGKSKVRTLWFNIDRD
jgi:transcriptional regulator with XRE-family HTH domain